MAANPSGASGTGTDGTGHVSVASFVILIGRQDNTGTKTRLEVKLGSKAAESGLYCKAASSLAENSSIEKGSDRIGDAWVGLQGNGNALLSGQNTWPMQHIFKSPGAERAATLCSPYVVLMAVCQAADPSFVPPPMLMGSVMRGEAVFQNLQLSLLAECLK